MNINGINTNNMNINDKLVKKLTGNLPVPASTMDKDQVAALLRVSPETLAAFEKSYRTEVLSDEMPDTENFFDVNARQMKSSVNRIGLTDAAAGITARIVDELKTLAPVMRVSRDGRVEITPAGTPDDIGQPVTPAEINALPENVRPQLTGLYLKKDVGGDSSGMSLLDMYRRMNDKSASRSARKTTYDMFRQGLDILDLDPMVYAMLGMNPNAIGYWLPALAAAVAKQDFFRIPTTTVVRVPMTLLQLTRLQYESLTSATFDVVNRFCFDVFGLDEAREYFVKTGTYSSKFDFRNAHVHGPTEVRELGQYLLFIQYQAQQMAGPLSKPCIYGASTTNEWAVREYIPGPENCPCIYKGMPLRTEYRVFVDFDADEILGMSPYWRPDVMKKRFSRSDAPDDVHDYITYAAAEPDLMARYEANRAVVGAHIKTMLQDIDLPGQWSVDVMQDGDDFWLIDMAQAATSALSDCVPAKKLRAPTERWLPATDADGIVAGPW